MAVVMNFIGINVNNMNNNCGVFVGANNHVGWDAHAKFSMGNGMFIGMNSTIYNSNVVIDQDIIDAPIFDQDFKPGFNNQQF
ncbi:hypothetical protein [Evansella tamaricis]|uniref:Uncharacterized protein n=1 Tax=Evansella tamaricis TaxID=2069301 RepID=A0ABS6JIN6_9BACI|nr:hypothetical protein [Evansella tamaricis]MBU9712325.1 hypothetical protein [Evansella tamaricis]